MHSRTLSLLLLGIFQACVSTYSPTLPVAPLLDEGGDVIVGGSVRVRGPKTGAAAFVAAAPSAATRVYASATMSRDRGIRELNTESGPDMRARDDTNRGEVGAGWGMKRRRMLLEVLGGAGYGRTDSRQCNVMLFGEYGEECGGWLVSRSRFVQLVAQAQAAAHFGIWRGGGGLRIAASRYAFDELFAAPSNEVSYLPTLEPFIVQRLVFDYVSLEAQLHIPLLLYGEHVRNPPTDQRQPAFILPAPRLWLGVQVNLDELWRKRRPNVLSNRSQP